MLRAAQLGAVTFDTNTLFVSTQYSGSEVMGEVVMSAAGSHIVYEASISTPYITLESQEHGIISETQREALMTMWNTLNTTYTLTYDDATTTTVRMAREKEIVFVPLWEGACDFTCTIPLAVV